MACDTNPYTLIDGINENKLLSLQCSILFDGRYSYNYTQELK